MSVKKFMESRLNINVSAIDYDKTSKVLTHQLTLLEEMVHGKEDFVMTDSEICIWMAFFCLKCKQNTSAKIRINDGCRFSKIKR